MFKKSLGKEEYIDLACLGIFSYSNPSKLVWDINKKEDISFERVSDLSILLESGKSYHTRFTFEDENFGTQFILLRNKGTQSELLKTKIDIPYLILILAGEFELAMESILPYLKGIEQIKAVQKLDKKLINKLIAYI